MDSQLPPILSIPSKVRLQFGSSPPQITITPTQLSQRAVKELVEMD